MWVVELPVDDRSYGASQPLCCICDAEAQSEAPQAEVVTLSTVTQISPLGHLEFPPPPSC